MARMIPRATAYWVSLVLLNVLLDWVLRFLILCSQALNALVLAGNPDETVSARCWRNRHRPGWGIARRFVDTLFFFDKDHCRKSHARDVRFARVILENETTD